MVEGVSFLDLKVGGGRAELPRNGHIFDVLNFP